MSPYPLAASLARPVARGYLTRDDADACLLAATLRARRLGWPYDPVGTYGVARHVLGLRLAAEEQRRDGAASRIRRLLKPMIGMRKMPSALLAEAHGVNGNNDFPLTEEEVTDIVRTEVWWSLPVGGRRHGR